MSGDDAKSAVNKCSVSIERGWNIGEEADKCCCCLPMSVGIYIITFFIFLLGINAVFTAFALTKNGLGATLLLIVALAPSAFGAFLVFLFWCRGKKRELAVQAVQCVLLSSILMAICNVMYGGVPWGAVFSQFLTYFYYLNVATRYRDE